MSLCLITTLTAQNFSDLQEVPGNLEFSNYNDEGFAYLPAYGDLNGDDLEDGLYLNLGDSLTINTQINDSKQGNVSFGGPL